MTSGGARARAVVVLVAAVAFAASPLVVGGFGGFDPGDFPVRQEDPPSQPAGWTFSIWGLIYVWLIVHAGLGWLRHTEDPAWDRTRPPMIVALGIGAAWIPVAEQSPVAATALIAAMLAASVLALLRAPETERWTAAVPLGLFAGWLTAATGVSVGILLGGWELAGPVAAAVIALAWTLSLGAAILGLRAEPAYALAAAWALLGIVAANGTSRPLVSALAAAGAIGLPALAIRLRRRTRTGALDRGTGP